MANELENNNGDIIIYQFEDGRIKLNVRLENTTVCLTKDQVAEFYEEARATIIEHILNADKESEIEESKTMRKSEIPFFPLNLQIITILISSSA